MKLNPMMILALLVIAILFYFILTNQTFLTPPRKNIIFLNTPRPVYPRRRYRRPIPFRRRRRWGW